MSYNCRVYDYPTGLHVSLYDKTNTKKDIQENENDNENNFKKSYKNEERTTEQEEHCIEQSLSKTKNTIYNLARSNIWDYFITLTFDGKITDRSSYDEVTKKLQNFLENLRKRKCPDLIYLIVPEFHLDGINYHFHGLIANTDGMHIIPSGKFTKDGKKIYKIKDWHIGWTTAIKVYDTVGASSYSKRQIIGV